MRVLIVDDEKNIRRTTTMALESMEHEVTCPSNSATALEELRKGLFDVGLLDLKLSSESGLDVLEEILLLPSAKLSSFSAPLRSDPTFAPGPSTSQNLVPARSRARESAG